MNHGCFSLARCIAVVAGVVAATSVGAQVVASDGSEANLSGHPIQDNVIHLREPGEADTASFRTQAQPEYPGNSLSQGEQGTALVLVLVDEEGRLAAICLDASSGYPALDKAAVRAVSRYTFYPARVNGIVAPSVAGIPVTFRIDKDLPPQFELPVDDSLSSVMEPEVVERIIQESASGDAHAATLAVDMYFAGLGVHLDPAKSIGLLERAANAGSATSATRLALLYRNVRGFKDPAKSALWFEKGASMGDADSQYAASFLYDSGEGLAVDHARALALLQKAADAGHAGAQNNLGWRYAQGSGVARDPVAAFGWYQKSAMQGNVYAEGNIGWAYEHGEGVARDDVLADAWFRLVPGNADVPEARDLPQLETRMTPEQVSEAKWLASSWSTGRLLRRLPK